MSSALTFDPVRLPEPCETLRAEVRAFLADEIARGTFDPRTPHHDESSAREFARRVATRGWIGLTWPKAYGGQERSFLERYVLSEEFYAVNAPVQYYFVADRQCGPMLLRYADESVRSALVPKIARGELSICIGMSEPDSGSDLFAAKARAERTANGWRLNGTKVWTTGAHFADYMVGYFRTSAPTAKDRRHGLTSFLVDMKSPGITVNRIRQMTGFADFAEVVFQDVDVPLLHAIGEIDGAWKQATVELSYERSGPERFLEPFHLLPQVLHQMRECPRDTEAESVGRLAAQLHAMRRMSVSVAGMLEAGKQPVVEAAIVKDLGTVWEQQLPGKLRTIAECVNASDALSDFLERLAYAQTVAPKYTIAGGTTEILRGIIARGLGVR